jgi:hypothetical protein
MMGELHGLCGYLDDGLSLDLFVREGMPLPPNGIVDGVQDGSLEAARCGSFEFEPVAGFLGVKLPHAGECCSQLGFLSYRRSAELFGQLERTRMKNDERRDQTLDRLLVARVYRFVNLTLVTFILKKM